ncbi:MAG: hypothetical protein GYA51_01685, partial [Candidatus Methanofastidiosa archaeon]|nr:hypothetical protein [Candidatus Methanofastidiosa archaeon]
MTAQVGEKLFFKGNEYYMASEPLNQYLRNLKPKPIFLPPSTACWRGYYGTWEIRTNQLYLISLIAYTGDHKKVGLEFLFPGETSVFAEWFSGALRIPQGKILRYIHFGYESVYERDLFLNFEKGCLLNDKIIENRYSDFDGLYDCIEKKYL